MKPKESARIIDAAGGDHQFATLLGITGDENYRQRVNNWKRRGFPKAVFWEHHALIQQLRDQIPKRRPS
jgi:hypothetical protein